jgi:predicted nucleotidyltransferase
VTGLYRLTKEQKAAVFAYLRILQEKYRDKIEQVVLFGSVARGEFDEESDVDIMIVLKNGSRRLRDEISMASFDLILRNNVILSPMVMDRKTYEWHKKYRDPLYNSIKKDGIDLWKSKQRPLSKSG